VGQKKKGEKKKKQNKKRKEKDDMKQTKTTTNGKLSSDHPAKLSITARRLARPDRRLAQLARRRRGSRRRARIGACAHACCGVVPDALEGDAPGCVVEGDIGALFFLEVSGERGSDE